MSDELKVSKKKITLALVILGALVIGFVAGTFFAPTAPVSEIQSQTYNLTEEDKQFLRNLANTEVSAIISQSAQTDWCTVNGGIWNQSTDEGFFEINKEISDELKSQGVTITETEGKYFAPVSFVKRDGCIIPKK
ncbi:MAG: hypothetical protein V1672_02930 [Candidatus Diapherotrites archaeon]